MLAKYAYNKDRSKNVHREDGTETETCCPVQAKKARTVKKLDKCFVFTGCSYFESSVSILVSLSMLDCVNYTVCYVT